MNQKEKTEQKNQTEQVHFKGTEYSESYPWIVMGIGNSWVAFNALTGASLNPHSYDPESDDGTTAYRAAMTDCANSKKFKIQV